MTDLELKERLRSHLLEIVRDRDPYYSSGGHFYVKNYLQQQLQQWGTVQTHEFQHQGKTHQNIILNLPGSNQQKPPILIGAHYDGVAGTPGADDNATGVAALLELVRAFAGKPGKYPLRFVAFDLEEYGLIGSTQYANDLKQQQQPLRLMISLEMLGYCTSVPHSQTYPSPLERFYPNQGNFIALVGNLGAISDLIHLRRQIRKTGINSEYLPVPNRGVMIPRSRWSDHAPFWDNGYRALMVTDTAMMRNPNYHKSSDTIETLDLDFLTGITQGLEIGIRSFS